MKGGVAKPVRCAIYTRVSTDQGLEQDFTRLTPNMMPHKPISAAKRTPDGACCEPHTKTGDSLAATPTGRLYGDCSTTCAPARST